MKCLAEFLLRLLVKTGKATPENRSAKPLAKVVFKLRFSVNNAIKLGTPQVFEILDFSGFSMHFLALTGIIINLKQIFCNIFIILCLIQVF